MAQKKLQEIHGHSGTGTLDQHHDICALHTVGRTVQRGLQLQGSYTFKSERLYTQTPLRALEE